MGPGFQLADAPGKLIPSVGHARTGVLCNKSAIPSWFLFAKRVSLQEAIKFRMRLLAISLGFVVCSLVFAGEPTESVFTAWVAEQGGSVKRDRSMRLQGVCLRATWIADTDLSRLAAIKGLHQLDLSFTHITDLGLERLKPLPSLVDLNLHHAEFVTDEGVAHLRGWKALERLNLKGTKITDTALEHLAGVSSLKWLDVSFTQVTDGGLEHLTNLPRLETLVIGGNKMAGTSLPLLKLFPALTHLDLSGKQRTDSGLWGILLTDLNLDSIAVLTRLQSLNLGGARVTDFGVSKLKALTELRDLDLSKTQVTGGALKTLAALPKLERLRLWNAERLDDSALAALRDMKQLTVLDLTETRITDQGAAILQGLGSLREVYLGGTEVTAERAEQIRQANPQCFVSWWKSKPAIGEAASEPE